MKKILIVLVFVAGLIAIIPGCRKAEYRALIVTGQNLHHDWKLSFPVLKTILDESGLFATDVAITPGQGEDMTRFKPVFSKYNVVVIDYCGDSWSDETKNSFVEYVSNGGGVVIYHGSSIAFPDWKEYNEMTGLGGWGDRTKEAGAYYFFRNNRLVVDDTSDGVTGTHGRRREFEIRTRNTDHPVMKGLPARWMHGSDELYSRLRGPGKNMEILATANADTTGKGPARDEPMLMTITYGNGRIFHTTMGHALGEGGGPAMQCAGFITTLQRGAEWAASGNVTQPVPNDFPTASGVVLRPDFKILTLDEDFRNLGRYEIGKSTRYLTDVQGRIVQAAGDPAKLLEIEKLMVDLLNNNEATTESKKLVLRELSWMGTAYCHETVKKMINVPEIADEAEFAVKRLEIK